MIRHELAHIRRHDIPVLIIASTAGALHWFNPIVWGIIRRLRAAMEAAGPGWPCRAYRKAMPLLMGNCCFDLLRRVCQPIDHQPLD